MANKEAEEEEDDAPDSEEPASEKPKPAEAKAEAKKAVAEKAEVEKAAPDKPVSKSVEWGLAIAMMVILVGFLFFLIHFMRSARSAVM